jgi:peptide/nickel transport system permease protein
MHLIGDRIGWSLFFTLTSIFLAYLISIPIGIKSAAQINSSFDRVSGSVLLVLYSLPVFWVATLLLMTFANPDALYLFPAAGVKPAAGYPAGAGFFGRMMVSIPYLILPTLCYMYSSVTFISRLTRTAMVEILGSDFIRTARAKGLTEKKVLWKHALKNSLFPVVTVFAHVFPAMIGGSVIVESIFTIPGMGSAIYQSIAAQDYPVLIAVFTITGLLTLCGYLVSDLLYAWIDPRISFSKQELT